MGKYHCSFRAKPKSRDTVLQRHVPFDRDPPDGEKKEGRTGPR